MKTYLKQFGVILLAVIGINIWQSRNMPQGVAPVANLKTLGSSSAQDIPRKDGSIQLLYFFAPWCGVCAVGAPNAVTVGEWMPELKVSFVGLDYETVQEVKDFADANLKGEVFLGNASVRSAWSVEAYPSYAIVDGSGKISHVAVGYSTVLGIAFHVLKARAGL